MSEFEKDGVWYTQCSDCGLTVEGVDNWDEPLPEVLNDWYTLFEHNPWKILHLCKSCYKKRSKKYE